MTLPTENDRRDFNKQRGITVVLRRDKTTDARHNGTSLRGLYRYVEQPLCGEERIDQGVKGGRTGKSPRPHWMCGYGEPELKDDDPGKQNKIADATDEICRPNLSRLKVG